MKNTELRIGNIIQWNNKPFKVCRIFTESVENELWNKPLNELHPIPLTEEIFAKCGFVYIKETFSYHNKQHMIQKSLTGVWNVNIFCANDIDCFIKVEYLHELQNLMFAVSKTELLINL